MSETSTGKVVIIGGGISGLATAFFLKQRNIQSILIEKTGRLGGLIQTDHVGGCDLEAGPDSFVAAKTSVAALAQELGISDRIAGSNDGARQIFIQRNGKLIPMPQGMSMMVPGDVRSALRSPLFTVSTKLRFLAERRFAPRERETDISIEEFVADHFGRGLVDVLAEPLLSGVYGGDAAKLSAASVLPTYVEYERKFGSLIAGVRASRKVSPRSLFLSFEGGMQTLTDALVRAVDGCAEVQFTTAKRVMRTDAGWRVAVDNGGVLDAADVVLACPAYAAGSLVAESVPALNENLAAIPYSSAILVMLVYDRETLGHSLNGFGILIPRSERRHIAAATWVSTKFPSRTPENLAALRGFIVGDDALRLMKEPECVLVKLAREEFQSLMGIVAEPRFATVHRWPESMPQYLVGHQQRCERITAILSELPGLHICGNAYSGVGIPDCVRLARQVASSINVN